MWTRKANIDPRIRAKFEELGVDAIRSKLHHVTGVRALGQQNEPEEDLGDGLLASGKQMRGWLSEQAAREACWLRFGVIAAVLAAIFSLLALVVPSH